MQGDGFLIPIIMGFIFIILGILMYNGKCLNLIAGYNTLSKEEKEKIDKAYLGQNTGLYLNRAGILTIILGLSIKYFAKYLSFVVILFILVIIADSILLIYKVNKKR